MSVNHYSVLGLLNPGEGVILSQQDINKAFRSKARELHPDKRRDDPNAHSDFVKLQSSYGVLKDEKARKLFDDRLRVKREILHRHGQQDSKRRKMISDLEERERAAANDPCLRAREEEERISQKLKEEIAAIRAMHKSRTTSFKRETAAKGKDRMEGGGNGLDKEKVLKVSWENIGEDYTAQRLGEIFEKFGVVEDVVLKSRKKKGLALVVMASKDVAVSLFSNFAAIGNVLGDISNPLLVLPLQPTSTSSVFGVDRNESDDSKLGNLVGAGYQAFEESAAKGKDRMEGGGNELDKEKVLKVSWVLPLQPTSTSFCLSKCQK